MKQPTTATDELDSPARKSFAITPDDSNEIDELLPRFLYTGSGGTIVMQLEADEADTTFTNVAAGVVMWVRPRIIKDTGTTATGLVGLY